MRSWDVVLYWVEANGSKECEQLITTRRSYGPYLSDYQDKLVEERYLFKCQDLDVIEQLMDKIYQRMNNQDQSRCWA